MNHTGTIAQGTSLPLMEGFYTLQGEGSFQGHAAYFIRIAGCDVGCVWCDVKESWEAGTYPVKDVEEIAEEASRYPAEIAVITGGEPLMYDMAPLCRALKEKGFRLHLETSGAHELTGQWDWICLSPKKFKWPVEGICREANELKVVVYNQKDFDWGEKYRDLVGAHCELFLQPEWSKRETVTPWIVTYIKKHPQWKVSLQTHKYLQIP